MNVSTTNLRNNQLKITFLFSALLHVAGFYILSGISFNQTSRPPDIVPIKVMTHVEKKGIQAVNVKHVTQQSPRQSTQSPKLAPTTLNEVFDSKPTLIHTKTELSCLASFQAFPKTSINSIGCLVF